MLNPQSCYFVSISPWLLQLPPCLMETSWRGKQPLNLLNPKTGSSRAKQGQWGGLVPTAELGSYKSSQEYRPSVVFSGASGASPPLNADTYVLLGPFWGILYWLLLYKVLVVTMVYLQEWICGLWTPVLPHRGCSLWSVNTPTGFLGHQTVDTLVPSACSCWTVLKC